MAMSFMNAARSIRVMAGLDPAIHVLWLAQFSEIARTLPEQRHAVKEYILNI
jgi:hypothetical protein